MRLAHWHSMTNLRILSKLLTRKNIDNLSNNSIHIHIDNSRNEYWFPHRTINRQFEIKIHGRIDLTWLILADQIHMVHHTYHDTEYPEPF